MPRKSGVKIPKSMGSGSGFENLEKISKKSRKSRNPGDLDRNFKMPRKTRVENLEISGIGIFFRDIGIFLNFGIFIPGKNPRGFLSRDQDFIVGWDIPTKKPTLILIVS